MKYLVLKKSVLYCAIVAVLFILLPGTVSAAEGQGDSVTSGTEVLVIEGKVRLFNPEKLSIVIQLKNGDKVKVWLDWNTTLVGYDSTDQIERKQKVKVWYSKQEGMLKVVKLEKKLMVGC